MLGWSRFHVAYKRGVTVVRLIDKNLVKEAQVRELACDLLDLIEAGNHRVVLNFQVVERLASWVVVAVEEARRLCESADGGALKICGLPQQSGLGFPDRGGRRGKCASCRRSRRHRQSLARGIATARAADRDPVGDHHAGPTSRRFAAAHPSEAAEMHQASGGGVESAANPAPRTGSGWALAHRPGRQREGPKRAGRGIAVRHRPRPIASCGSARPW